MLWKLELLWYWITSPRKMFQAHHPHILKIKDMALGLPVRNGDLPVTGFLLKCRFCDQEFLQISEVGRKQLSENDWDEVFQWMGGKLEKSKGDT